MRQLRVGIVESSGEAEGGFERTVGVGEYITIGIIDYFFDDVVIGIRYRTE